MRIPFTRTQVPLGHLVAPFTRFVPARAVVPILQGPAKGLKWVAGSGMPNFWLGTYEREKYEAFSGAVGPGMTVYDIGANAGYYSVMAARKVGPSGKVCAFEPATMNLYHLHANKRANRLVNLEVVPMAVGDTSGAVYFDTGRDLFTGSVSADGLIKVPCTTLDTFGGWPDLMKIDVEGGEFGVLVGAIEMMQRAKPTIFLATHGDRVHGKCCLLLEQLGYKLEYLAPDEIVATSNRTHL